MKGIKQPIVSLFLPFSEINETKKIHDLISSHQLEALNSHIFLQNP